MSLLTIHRKQMFKVGIPYWIYVNGHPMGIMRGREVNITMPAGNYEIAIRMVFQLFKWQFHIGGKCLVDIAEGEQKHLHITNREQVWNMLFDIDMVLWIAEFFFTLPYPWNITYKLLSNGFFVIWLIRLCIIKDKYFKII